MTTIERMKCRGKVLGANEWAFGYPFPAYNGIVIMHVADNTVEIDPSTLGQCTELKDKNGKEIYEGDILEGIHSRGKIISEVRWRIGGFDFMWGNYPLNKSCSHYMEIIGNIHDKQEEG